MFTDFSIADPTLKTFLSYYNSAKEHALLLLPIAIVVRSTLALRGGVDLQVEVIKDAAICAVLLLTFYGLIGLVLTAPEYATNIFGPDSIAVNVNPTNGDWFSISVSVISRFITFFAYVLAKGVYYISLLILIVIAAYAILATTMTSSYGTLLVYFGLLVFVGLIPTFWALINFGISKLFDPQDPDWNNGMIILASLAKVFLSWTAFKRTLYEPFLKNITSAFAAAGKGGIKAASLASGAGTMAKAGVIGLGGKHYTDGASMRIKSLKSSVGGKAKMTIPTAEKILGGTARMAASGIKGLANKSKPQFKEEMLQEKQNFTQRVSSNLGRANTPGPAIPNLSTAAAAPSLQSFGRARSGSMQYLSKPSGKITTLTLTPIQSSAGTNKTTGTPTYTVAKPAETSQTQASLPKRQYSTAQKVAISKSIAAKKRRKK